VGFKTHFEVGPFSAVRARHGSRGFLKQPFQILHKSLLDYAIACDLHFGTFDLKTRRGFIFFWFFAKLEFVEDVLPILENTKYLFSCPAKTGHKMLVSFEG
jgi:hypothetical protein